MNYKILEASINDWEVDIKIENKKLKKDKVKKALEDLKIANV